MGDLRLGVEAKAALDITLLNLNLELSRLRSLQADLEEKEIQQKKKFSEHKEDNEDIIIYLKHILREAEEDLRKLETIKAAKENNKNQSQENQQQVIAKMENEFRDMQAALINEHTQLENQLHSMNDIRNRRDALMKIMEQQEVALEKQKARHVKEQYDLEKKFTIEQHRLEVEINEKLKDLINNLEKESPLRLAATEKRLIRENIFLNNIMQTKLKRVFSNHNTNKELLDYHTHLKFNLECNLLEKASLQGGVDKLNALVKKLTMDYESLYLTHYLYSSKDTHTLQELMTLDDVLQTVNSDTTTLKQLILEEQAKFKKINEEFFVLEEENKYLMLLKEKVRIACCGLMMRRKRCNVEKLKKLVQYGYHKEIGMKTEDLKKIKHSTGLRSFRFGNTAEASTQVEQINLEDNDEQENNLENPVKVSYSLQQTGDM